MNRRQFLISSGVVLGAAAMKVSAQTKKRPLGIQLYTVRKQARKHLPDVLAAIREIGYEEVETYWDVYSRPAGELKRLINDHGLRVPSGHFDYDGLEGKLDYAATLGISYLVCPMLPKKMRTSLDGFKQAADQFNKWGEKIKAWGCASASTTTTTNLPTGDHHRLRRADVAHGSEPDVPGNGLLLDHPGGA